ncbi:polysaccharide deacetylase family protein [Mechercharimyces sp. CAU 1602]|uniref:polysaccharide deacetylase family protein n=1 Tax=Mechercharimyces sp. CAU 1602 TaxID=2973933 RepID=UPI002162BFB1|nr:polysaccharide deacetylase family protein [Mechercharimyces sp. CAU 1602]MCS1351265.1 polysaccharide deacetylase family protein [Mechercharimyces sp. CAU 1602]
MEPRIRKVWVVIFVAMITGALLQSTPMTEYAFSLQESQATLAPLLDPLKKRIEEEKEKRREEPIEARVDRVWGLIPGYNGIEVDVERTVEETKKLSDTEKIAWQYREIKTKKSLDEWGAHPIYRGNEAKPLAALMINVAWGTEHLPEMLSILRQHEVKATFFLDGSWLAKNPNEAKKLIAEGHEVGNHGYSHPLMSRISAGQVRQEIAKTEELISQHLGLSSKWFAPPAGDYNQRVVDVAHQLELATVLWTVDTIDWRKNTTPAQVVARMGKAENGSLVLMHPTRPTVEALAEGITAIEDKGIGLDTVSDVLSAERVK